MFRIKTELQINILGEADGMFAKKFSVGVSGVALAVCGAGLAVPAYAQDADPAATPEAESIDDAIIVTARRQALKDAISIKRDSDTIVDSVTADEAGRLPDNSITEVLQRVSGVSISRFTGGNGGSTAFQIEGTGITVRGLPFNSSMLNGRQLFSANGASSFGWNEITPELMAGVDVYKASRADMIEGGASMVNLRTHVPFNFNDTQFNVSLGNSYGDQAKKSSPRVSALFSKRFDTGIGEIGVLWDVAYSSLHQQSSNMQVGAMFGEYVPTSTRDDGLALVPSSFRWGTSKSKRDRYGAYQAIQWKPASNLTLTNTLFFSQYVEDRESNTGALGTNPSAAAAVMPAVGSPVEYDANGAFRKGTLAVGSTGKAVDFTNTTKNVSWLRPWYQLDCGASYGAPASTIQWDWSADGNIDPSNPPVGWNGRRLAQCGPAATLNPTGSAGVSHSKNSTLDISQSFVWTPGDRVAVRGAAQYVSSRMSGQDMYVGLNQSSPQVNSMHVDLTGPLPVLSGLSNAGMLDPSKAYLANFAYHAPRNRGKMLAGNIDLEYRVSDEGFLRKIAVGARAARRTENDNFVGTYFAPLGQPWAANKWGNSPNDPNYGPGNIQYLTNPNVPASDYQVAQMRNFFGGKASVPGQLLVPSSSLMHSYDWYRLLTTYNGQLRQTAAGSNVPIRDSNGVIIDGTRDQYWTANIDQGLNKTESRIKNIAAYVQASFAHDRVGILPAFSGNIGVRIFRDSLHATGLLRTPDSGALALTQEDSTAYFNAQQADPGTSPAYPTLYKFVQAYTPQTREYEYTRVLPSMNIKFDVTNKFIIRGAASKSTAPPNLNDIRAGGYIDARSLANPTNSQAPGILTGVVARDSGANLKPTMITSEDLAFEYYPSSSSFIALNLFAKQIKDHPLFSSFVANNLPIPALAFPDGVSTATQPDGSSLGTPTTLDLPWLFLQNKSSTRKAYIKGFEISGRKFFDKLPGLFRGLGIEGNLTFIDSSNPAQQANHVLSPATANGGLNPDGTVPQTYPNLPYSGLSKWAYNVQLLYSRDRLNVRLAYNWRDKALLSTNVNPLSYATSGGNPYTLNTSPTNFDADHSWPVYNMVPAWMAAAGYLDLGVDFKVTDSLSFSFNANNLLNTISRTYQEPIPGVFQPYDYNVSDQRFDLSVRMRF
ncbi:TonB-dependent receptor [Sphingopyxis sp. JAI128]|uniref:TonB-dependent receptor n=1 Tax=Sphingopyxis sp. JAI128 TaxID=2723066 RepID=UPI00185260E3|nr:TonB-dependent receptor [Sphingopyxis sp. JAI128]MBB6427841.1 TonB-dependent receptor [Sphingopyxis sp. JAI128]